jgi:hypothetical protein
VICIIDKLQKELTNYNQLVEEKLNLQLVSIKTWGVANTDMLHDYWLWHRD